MIPPLVVLTQTTDRLSREEWRKVSGEVWPLLGAEWHTGYLPKHFQFAAVAEYGYAPRTTRYMKAKARSKGHQRPLVWKGELERMLTRMRDVTAIRARGDDQGGVNVRLSGPRYLHQRQQPKQPNLAEEISAVSAEDLARLNTYLDELMTDALNQSTDPREVA